VSERPTGRRDRCWVQQVGAAGLPDPQALAAAGAADLPVGGHAHGVHRDLAVRPTGYRRGLRPESDHLGADPHRGRVRTTQVPSDLLIRRDILRTIPEKKEANMNVDIDQFTQLFALRILNGH
jgi:hypothetical protein